MKKEAVCSPVKEKIRREEDAARAVSVAVMAFETATAFVMPLTDDCCLLFCMCGFS